VSRPVAKGRASPPGKTYSHRRTRRGVGEGGRPQGLKNFRANSVFRARASCSKILNDEKYFNTVKKSRATLFFWASASCSKLLIIKITYSIQ